MHDTVIDTMAYMSLKANFKSYLIAKIGIIDVLLQGANSLQYQSLVFMMLNLVRDKNFGKLPSNTLGEHEKSDQMDISYYELKEL